MEGLAASEISLDLAATHAVLVEIFEGNSISEVLDRINGLREKQALALGPHPPIPQRVTALRKELQKLSLDGFLIPLANEHQGEFIEKRSQRLEWLTGFSGSAGLAVVLRDRAAIFTDGRYTLQVSKQVDPKIFKPNHVTDTPPNTWICENLEIGSRIGFDPWLHTPSDVKNLEQLCIRNGIKLLPLNENPLDTIWKNQPPRPLGPVVVQSHQYTGKSSAIKRSEIGNALIEAGEDAIVITALDSIAWLLNIRGFDVAHTPLTLSYAIVDQAGKVDWFIDPRKLTDQTKTLVGNGVFVHEPANFVPMLSALGAKEKKVRLDLKTASEAVRNILTKSGAKVVDGGDLCFLPKAIKSASEINGSLAAHVRDGAALTSFLSWLSRTTKHSTVTEMSAASMLYEFRRKDPKFRGLSFETISGSGPNGAIVHYRVTPETDRRLSAGDIYLVDSGAQYLDGTTDVTRTVYIEQTNGFPAPLTVQEHFTRVLKGHIAIAEARFPHGTSGPQIDALARIALWEVGLDYDHGTGHGVGSYLSVHEGPQRISKKGGPVPMEPGMIISNEPGYYKEGVYGIRIENLVVVTVSSELAGDKKDRILSFETLTLAPIDKNLIIPQLLNENEKNWLNQYHQRVRDTLSNIVDEDARDWLIEATTRI